MEKIRYILLGLLIVSGAAVGAEPVGRPDKGVMTKFQDALYQEQTAGDLDKAIELYQQVVTESAEVERLAARATFQLGVCYLKKGDKEKAAEYFGKVVSDYPAQKELAKRAARELDKMGFKNAEHGRGSSFTANINNRVTVELIGLCRYTEGGIECFRADGSLLERKFSISKRNQTPKAGDVGIMLRIDGLEGSPSYHSIEGAKSSEGSCQVNDEHGQPIKGWEAALAKFEEGRKTTNLVFGIPEGPWTTVAEHDGKTMAIVNGITFTRATESGRWVEISASDTLGSSVEQRLAVIDKNGTFIPWQGTRGSVSTNNLRQSSGSFADLKLDQIQKFVFQTRPYQWVAFKNVSLQPGMQTNVEVYINDVKVESRREYDSVSDPAEKEKIVGHWKSVDFVSSPDQFQPDKKLWKGSLFLKEAMFNADGSSSLPLRWSEGWVHDLGSNVKAEYYIKIIDGKKYLFLPWLSGDVTIRGQKPHYYVLRGTTPDLEQQPTEQEKQIEKAVAAAQAWLELVDKGQYGKSWDEAAGFFRMAVSKKQWESAVGAARKPLGDFVSREVLTSSYTRQVPGAPDGEYVVIQFKAAYANKKEAIETVTPMLDSDGQWRVSGYFVK